MRDILFESERLIFSKWEKNDIVLASELWSSAETCKYITKNGFFTENEIKEKLDREMKNYVLYNYQYFPVFIKDTKDFAGCSGFRPYSEDTIEFGVHLLPDYWGIGLGTEAGRRTLDYGFQHLKAEKIFAGHNPQNTSSSKMLLKLGFTKIKEEYYPPTGLMHPSYLIAKPQSFQ